MDSHFVHFVGFFQQIQRGSLGPFLGPARGPSLALWAGTDPLKTTGPLSLTRREVGGRHRGPARRLNQQLNRSNFTKVQRTLTTVSR